MRYPDDWDPFDALSPEEQVHWDRDLGWFVKSFEIRANLRFTCNWTAVAWVPRYGAAGESDLGHCFLHFADYGWLDRVYYLGVMRMLNGLHLMKTPREVWK